jgi:hypothetical protein
MSDFTEGIGIIKTHNLPGKNQKGFPTASSNELGPTLCVGLGWGFKIGIFGVGKGELVLAEGVA